MVFTSRHLALSPVQGRPARFRTHQSQTASPFSHKQDQPQRLQKPRSSACGLRDNSLYCRRPKSGPWSLQAATSHCRQFRVGRPVSKPTNLRQPVSLHTNEINPSGFKSHAPQPTALRGDSLYCRRPKSGPWSLQAATSHCRQFRVGRPVSEPTDLRPPLRLHTNEINPSGFKRHPPQPAAFGHLRPSPSTNLP